MNDPLQLSDKPTAIEIRLARSAPQPDVQRLYERINNPHCADSVDVRVLLLAHLTYMIYRDIKEALAQ
jgi:hypothetical protein